MDLAEVLVTHLCYLEMNSSKNLPGNPIKDNLAYSPGILFTIPFSFPLLIFYYVDAGIPAITITIIYSRNRPLK